MILEELYSELTGTGPSEVTPLTPAGSSRRYFRLTGPRSVVGVVGTQKAENEAFIYLANHFETLDLPAPRVLAVSHDRMAYLQTDLGDTSLWDVRHDAALLEKTMGVLPWMQTSGLDSVDWGRCYPVSRFDTRAVMWDLNYFKYSYLNPCGITYSEPHLEEAMRHLAERMDGLLTPDGSGLMLRDCQTRNVMIDNGGAPWFIDFQGARLGPLAYDVASFIYQAKAQFPPALRQRLAEAYLSGLAEAGRRPEGFEEQLHLCGMVRTLQVLGAYGFRGLVQGKGHFIQSIPYALSNLRDLIDTGVLSAPKLGYLRSLLTEVASVAPIEIVAAPAEGLTVRVTSFSYKKGIPPDPSGNGGGFVFDCRAMENPGRYEEYRSLTGLDAPVIDFLEDQGEVQVYLDACHSLVDPAVATYLVRGFSSLAVNFGCTGGRHRSVYCAEHMAIHLKEMFPEIHVILNHREQKITRVL